MLTIFAESLWPTYHLSLSLMPLTCLALTLLPFPWTASLFVPRTSGLTRLFIRFLVIFRNIFEIFKSWIVQYASYGHNSRHILGSMEASRWQSRWIRDELCGVVCRRNENKERVQVHSFIHALCIPFKLQCRKLAWLVLVVTEVRRWNRIGGGRGAARI